MKTSHEQKNCVTLKFKSFTNGKILFHIEIQNWLLFRFSLYRNHIKVPVAWIFVRKLGTLILEKFHHSTIVPLGDHVMTYWQHGLAFFQFRICQCKIVQSFWRKHSKISVKLFKLFAVFGRFYWKCWLILTNFWVFFQNVGLF